MASDIISGKLNQPNPIDSANKVMNHIWENHVFVSTKSNSLEERTGITYLLGLSYIELNRPHHYQLTESGKQAYLNGGVMDYKFRPSKKSKFSKFINADWFKNITINIIASVISSLIFFFLVYFLFREFVV